MTHAQIAALIIQVLLEYGPGWAQAITEIMYKENPTAEDWAKVFALPRKTYEEYTAPVKPA